MTDEQIVKALECCIKSDHFGECFANKCPMISEEGCKVWNDDHKLLNMLYDLIKRQQAEIERLEAECENAYKQAEADIKANIADGGTGCHWRIDKHRAEAVREFAEFLIDKAENNVIRIGDLCDYVIDFNEMTEGKENG